MRRTIARSTSAITRMSTICSVDSSQEAQWPATQVVALSAVCCTWSSEPTGGSGSAAVVDQDENRDTAGNLPYGAGGGAADSDGRSTTLTGQRDGFRRPRSGPVRIGWI